MPEVIINDVPVDFPFTPYDVQKEYMSKVLECLKKGVNGVLESPTGTGKTLSLLCSSLAWLEIKKAQVQVSYKLATLGEDDQKNELVKQLMKSCGGNKAEGQAWAIMTGTPKIIYASRTHSQLGQVVAELKRTKYAHFKVAVMGSREQMCLNPEVNKEQNSGMKVALCRAKVASRTCHFHNNIEARKQDPLLNDIMDIEDLVSNSQKLQCCPYYMSRELQKNADIVFVPYNYLLDPHIRKKMDIQLSNNVIILDEGHNVEKVCEEAASVQLCSTDIALCITEITQVMKDMHEQMTSGYFEDSGVLKDFTADDLCILKTLFTALEEAVDRIDLSSRDNSMNFDSNNSGAAFPGSYILDLLAKVEVTPEKLQLLETVIHNISQYLVATTGSSYQNKGAGLQKFGNFIKVVDNSLGPTRSREGTDMFYKVYIEPEVTKKGRADIWASKTVIKMTAKTINFWCFNAGCGMKSLLEQGVHCIVLTSGTLAPLDATISEIGIPVDVRLENPHIIKNDQVCVSVVAKGPTNIELKSTFENRGKTEYLRELGLTLQNFSRVIPEGLLVFFPSYPMMETSVNYWQQTGLWSKIVNNKPIFIEPQRKVVLNEVITKYYEKLNEETSKGAILLAVCRGKVSEGVDFADCKGRAVIVTGLPYPPFKDPRVVLKRQYLDQNKQAISGMDWYQMEATRAVNQAIGRVIRHVNDYGAILLCDSRFGNSRSIKSLSKWLQPHIKNCDHFRFAYSGLVSFFRNANMKVPTKPQNVGASFVYDSEIKVREIVNVAETKPKESSEVQVARMNYLLETSKKFLKPKSRLTDLLSALDSVEDNHTSSSSHCFGSENDCLDVSLKGGFIPSSVSDFIQKEMSSYNNQSSCSTSMKERLSQNQFEGTSSQFKDNESPSGSATKKRKIFVVNKSSYSSEKSSKSPSPSTVEALSNIGITNMKIIGYWSEIKRAVNKENFNKFKSAVEHYKVNNDFNSILASLLDIFPLENETTHNLFKAFTLLLSRSHKMKFEEFCNDNIKN